MLSADRNLHNILMYFFFFIYILCVRTYVHDIKIPTSNTIDTKIVDTSVGLIRGLYVPVKNANNAGNAAISFLGIPYAKPPVGSRRFSPAELLIGRIISSNQTEPFNATSFGADCWQGGYGDTEAGYESEDCLYLNVWKPANATNISSLSVMVYIYGGGFQAGSSADRWANGAQFAVTQNIIVVSMNYRLGALGFFASYDLESMYNKGTGALNGILDQIVALQWVQQNIESFGGDPNFVTIFGESAGGESVCILNLSPVAKGLFRRAIIQSGPCAYSYWSPHNSSFSIELGKQIMANANVTTIAALQSISVENIQWPDVSESQFFNGYFAPDGYVLHSTPQELLESGNRSTINAESLIVGTTSMDGTLTLLYPGLKIPIVWYHYKHRMKILYGEPNWKIILNQYNLGRFNSTTYNGASYGYIRSDSDRALICPTKQIIGSILRLGVPVYSYVYDYGPTIALCDQCAIFNPVVPHDEKLWWASHGTDIRMVFMTTTGRDISPTARTVTCPMDSEEKNLSTTIQSYWSSFAKSGQPSGKYAWPIAGLINNATVDKLVTLRLGKKLETITGYHDDDCTFWKRLSME